VLCPANRTIRALSGQSDNWIARSAVIFVETKRGRRRVARSLLPVGEDARRRDRAGIGEKHHTSSAREGTPGPSIGVCVHSTFTVSNVDERRNLRSNAPRSTMMARCSHHPLSLLAWAQPLLRALLFWAARPLFPQPARKSRLQRRPRWRFRPCLSYR
jgi:hypothetical protein